LLLQNLPEQLQKLLLWLMGFRYIKFGLVGASGTLVNMAVLYAAQEWMFNAITEPRDRLYASLALAIAVATLNNFTWNRLWTWADRKRALAEALPVPGVGRKRQILQQLGPHFGLGGALVKPDAKKQPRKRWVFHHTHTLAVHPELGPHAGQVDARDAFACRHIGKQFAHGTQPALRLGVAEASHAPHLFDRAAGNGCAFESAQVEQLKSKRELRVLPVPKTHRCPQTGVVHLKTPNPQSHGRGRHHATQSGHFGP
jgi:hypothetical protein